MVFAVVTGGGTSGHVIPAIALLEALEDAGYPSDMLRYVGSRRGIEQRLMQSSSVAAEYLSISGLQRSLHPSKIFQNIMLPIRLSNSTAKAMQLLREWNPAVVISVGGYASVPIARAARKLRIPLLCVSYDRKPGLATKKQQYYAVACAVAFEDSTLRNARHTGAPVRRDLRLLDVTARRPEALKSLNIRTDHKVVTVVGGSLGSGLLNSSINSILTEIDAQELRNITLIHICGERFLSEPAPVVPSDIEYRRIGYSDQMSDIYAVTDLLVCRAGASTVAEIATVGLAAIIVPWKDAADNHQELNAHWLADPSAAIMMSERECRDGYLGKEVSRLLRDDETRNDMADRAREMGAIHRSSALVDLVKRISYDKNDKGQR
jgi:UDP-N-acetylglucosamine--N-acetylmuramyl-(pentapeptide) pyrophosphoryl-undecaprenol N-acetylglucosamine transferase